MRYPIFATLFAVVLFSCQETNSKLAKPEIEKKQTRADTSTSKVATNRPSNTSAVEQMVLAIRKEFNRINTSKVTTKTIRFVCDTDATATYFTENGKVIKIAVDWGFVGDGSSKSEYYYKDGKLIFIFYSYTGGCANCPVTATEYRTYVHNDRTIKYLKNVTVTECTTCTFNERSKEYKALSAVDATSIKAALCK